MTDDPAICHRCARLLRRGHAELYIVRIEAVADPEIAHLDMPLEDLAAEYDRLIEQMQDQSETELTEQVHRALTITLCNTCYRHWIDNPTP